MVDLAVPSGATGPARGKRKFNEEKWQRILHAAAETFADRGYEATSIRDVAEAVGMLGGSLYYYMKTKEDLLFALIDDFHQSGMEGVAAAEAEAVEAGYGDDPLAVLRAVCIRHAEINLRSRTLTTVFYHEFRHLSEERKQHIVESRRRHQHRIEELIMQAQAAGEVSPTVDPRLSALAMLSLLNATNTWYQPEKDRSGQAIPEFLASLLIDGLSGATVPAGQTAPPAKTAARPKNAANAGRRGTAPDRKAVSLEGAGKGK